MRQVSIFCDEAGEQGMTDGYCLLTLIVHDQSLPMSGEVEEYETQLRLGKLRVEVRPQPRVRIICQIR